jgi:hypothetical protein
MKNHPDPRSPLGILFLVRVTVIFFFEVGGEESLPGVADVACRCVECVVNRCLPGYEPAHDGLGCIHKYSQFDDASGEDVFASVYGLEHVPLGVGRHRDKFKNT